MEIYKKFVVSREKFSRESVRVDDLYFTPNYEGEITEDQLKEVIAVLDYNFPSIIDIDRKTVTNLIHLFDHSDVATKFFIATLPLIKNYKGKRFEIKNDNKLGAMVLVKESLHKFEIIEQEEKPEPVIEPVIEEKPEPVIEPVIEEKPEPVTVEKTEEKQEEKPEPVIEPLEKTEEKQEEKPEPVIKPLEKTEEKSKSKDKKDKKIENIIKDI